MKRLTMLEWTVAGLMLALVLVVFTQVALRYLTYQPLFWTEEVGRYVFIWLALLGAAEGARRGMHFAVDLLPRRLPPRAGSRLRAAIHLAEAALYGLLAWAGVLVVQVTHVQTSPSIALPMSLPYGALPVAGGLLCVFSLRRAWAQWHSARKD
jgi:TRAP-type C4-dicarboxylate transport system permease small subunit